MKKIILFSFFLWNCNRISNEGSYNYVPPFEGTIFIDPDIITPEDPTTFISIKYIGMDSRKMYDRRVDDWVELRAYLLQAYYDDSLNIEVQVNPEFGSKTEAEIQVKKYAAVVGHLTTELRKYVKTIWIHKGLKPFGGGNNNLLIHTDWSIKHYEDQGILEETFIINSDK